MAWDVLVFLFPGMPIFQVPPPVGKGAKRFGPKGDVRGDGNRGRPGDPIGAINSLAILPAACFYWNS